MQVDALWLTVSAFCRGQVGPGALGGDYYYYNRTANYETLRLRCREWLDRAGHDLRECHRLTTQLARSTDAAIGSPGAARTTDDATVMGLQRWLVEARAMIRAGLANLGALSSALGTVIGEARSVAVIDPRLPFDAATAWQLQPKADEVRSAIGALEGRLAGAQEKLGNAEQQLTSACEAKPAGIARAFDLQAFKLEVDGARRQLADFGLSAAVAATASETVASPPINRGRIVQITYRLPTGVPGQTVPVGVSFLGDMRGPCVLASMIDPQFYINWRFQPLTNGAYQLRVNNSPTGLVLAAPWRLEDPVEVVPEALLGQRPDRAWWTFVGNYLVSTFDRRHPYVLGPNFDQQPADHVFGSIVSGVRLLGPNARLRNEALPGFFEVYLLFY